MNEIEESFREAALSCRRIALSKFLSEMPEKTPICSNRGVKMKNFRRQEKQIFTLIGSSEYSRNYYGCECGEHLLPKDDMLNVNGTKFIQTVKRVTTQIASSDS